MAPKKSATKELIQQQQEAREEEQRREARKPFTQAVVALWEQQGVLKEKLKKIQKVADQKNPNWQESKEWDAAFDQVVFGDPEELLPLIIVNLCHLAFSPYASEPARLKASEMLMSHIKETSGDQVPSKITKTNILELSEKVLIEIITGKGFRNHN